MTTKAQAIMERDQAKKMEWLHYEVLAAQTQGEAIKVGQFTEDGITVTAWLINPTRAHGGLVQIRHFAKNNEHHPSFTVNYIEDEHSVRSRQDMQNEYWFQYRELIGRAMVMRNRALGAAAA